MPLLLSILYAVLRLLIDLALVRSRNAAARDIELLALRHEVRVLRREAKRNRWWPGDRLVLSALSQALTRSDWGRLPVRPDGVASVAWFWRHLDEEWSRWTGSELTRLRVRPRRGGRAGGGGRSRP